MFSKTQHPLRSQAGSALITCIIFVAVLSLIIGSALTWSTSERRLNQRHAMRLEARNAAEAIAEYAFAQVRYRMDNQTSFPANVLDPAGSDALLPIPTTLFKAGNVDTSSLEMLAGVVKTITNNGSSTHYWVDPSDPNNQFDPMKGKQIFRRDVQILAKASVNNGLLTPITAYVGETLAMREAPLFAHALFYNMDLELGAGADFTIIGPVHTNGDLWVVGQANNGSQTDFRGTVTVGGGVFWGYKTTPVMGNGSLEPVTQEDIRFSNKAGAMINLRSGSGVWRDHKMGTGSVTTASLDSFRNFSSNTYNGYLSSSVHGIENYKPVAFGDYVEDPTPYNGTDESQNTGRAIIERPIASHETGYNAEIEKQKLSRKSGLYIAVNPSSSSRTAKKPDGTDIVIPAGQYRAFKKDGTEVNLPGATAATAGTAHPVPGARPIIKVKNNQMTDLRRFTNFNYNATRSSTNQYDPKVVDIIEFDMTAFKMAVDYTVNGQTKSNVYNYDSGSVDSTYKATSKTDLSLNSSHEIKGFSASDWNGAVYVESVDAETRRDSGVRIINARGQVAGRPAGSTEEGLTLATNDAMYVLGHFNADGSVNTSPSSSTNSSRYPENSSEIPAALAADAITVLSQPTFSGSSQVGGWNDALSDSRHTTYNWSSSWYKSKPSNYNYREGNGNRRNLTDKDNPLNNSYSSTSSSSYPSRKFYGQTTEISAALLTGIVPSNKDGSKQNSGGAHNFPRLLEYWNGTLAIRGSMVALFESRIATEPWSIRYYNAPARFWGFNDMFAQGRYPPQTPVVRTYRRVDFRDLSKTEYDTLKAALPW
jgi:hypothetical protein